jgi:hypothetical protein
MSTKISLKHHSEEGLAGAGFHLYKECMDDAFVYLEVSGVPFEGSTSVDLSGNGLSRVAVRLPNEWARKLGLIEPSRPAVPE